MKHLSLPYDRGYLTAQLADGRLAAVLNPIPCIAQGSSEEAVRAALSDPVSSAPLAELSIGQRKVVITTSDHTRPIPSMMTIPLILSEIRRGNPSADITILVGMGTHRQPTNQELGAKFGEKIQGRERIVRHHGEDPAQVVAIGKLPSGFPLEINRLAAEADLLIAEGFINPHLFAGFSGGPKSILPGIASHMTVKRNHCGRNIGHPKARLGIVRGNPIHEEMEAAADLARLAFILNIVPGEGGGVSASFAGNWREAHAKGMKFVAEHVGVPVVKSMITITSHGGYPLDQNLYQAVKGMVAAEATTIPGGYIILVAACTDGIGSDILQSLMAGMSSPAEFCQWCESIPPDDTRPDQWTAQILARILASFNVALVCESIPPGTKLLPGLTVAKSLQSALDEAMAAAGPEAMVTVVPDGSRAMPIEDYSL